MMTMTPPPIQVQVYAARQPIKLVTVGVTQRIQVLQSLFPSSPKQFYFKGQCMSSAMTFSFYKMCDKDVVVAVEDDGTNEKPLSISEGAWSMIKNEYDTLSEKLRWATMPDTALQISRLKDLQMNRLEMKPVALRRLLSSAYKGGSTSKNHRLINAKIASPNEPCHDPLPVFWPRPHSI